MLKRRTVHRNTPSPKPQIIRSDFDSYPYEIDLDTPLIKLTDTASNNLTNLFKRVGMTPTYRDLDGLGEVNRVVFKSVATDRWFNAFESIPSDGVVIQTHGDDSVELSRACEEVIIALGIEKEDLAWISNRVREGSKSRQQDSQQKHKIPREAEIILTAAL